VEFGQQWMLASKGIAGLVTHMLKPLNVGATIAEHIFGLPQFHDMDHLIPHPLRIAANGRSRLTQAY
jgi:hypothetical protein